MSFGSAEPNGWTHHLVAPTPDSEVKIHYVDCPPASSSPSSSPKTILLIHGFPQTWYEFRHIIPALTEMGLRVIAVDYRGAGASTRPVGGYDKMTMGKDLGDLVVNVLGLKKVLVLGHDIGSMVAVGMTLQFRDVVEGLMIMGESGGRSIALSRYI
jgi:pimeloyl-ACP methyl ester carboxylesterase